MKYIFVQQHSRIILLLMITGAFLSAPPVIRAQEGDTAVMPVAAYQEAVREAPCHYLNRLSDLLFVLSRVLNRMDGGDDVYWKSERLARSASESAE